jgi:hypothetical protein
MIVRLGHSCRPAIILPEVFEAVGRKVFDDEWTGLERNQGTSKLYRIRR